MTTTAPTTEGLDTPPAAGTVGCDSCTTSRAAWVLSYPDARFRVCSGCLPPQLGVVAEPLDADDELATDPRPVGDRTAPL